jgi:general L-amino acid transport system substrate-binding protein
MKGVIMLNFRTKTIVILSLLFSMFVIFACTAEETSSNSGSGSNTLATIIDRGELVCGVNDNLTGFGVVNSAGQFEGFDIDFCKAVAAAILGDAGKVEYVPLTASARFEALAANEIDILIRNTTWTASRDRDLGNDFTAPTFYDGQGMMVKASSGYDSIEAMEGATVCVLQGTTTELNLDDRFTGMDYTPLTFETNDPLQAAYEEGRCDGWTTDKSGLASKRAGFSTPSDHVVLAETLSKEPLGPLTRDNDSELYDVVQWVVFGMMQAEESGITSSNVTSMASNPSDPGMARLLGVGFDGGEPSDFGFGIDVNFMQNVISQVGNYGEVYERHLVPLGLTREGSLNAQWTDGGLIYAPPFR